MIPYWIGCRWTTVISHSGRTAETISEEMSVSRLQTPSRTTVVLTRAPTRRPVTARPALTRVPELSTRYT